MKDTSTYTALWKTRKAYGQAHSGRTSARQANRDASFALGRAERTFDEAYRAYMAAWRAATDEDRVRAGLLPRNP